MPLIWCLTSQLSGRAQTHHARWIDGHSNTSLSCAWHFISHGPLQRKLDMVPRESRQPAKNPTGAEGERRPHRSPRTATVTMEMNITPNIAAAEDGQLDTCDADNGINRTTAADSLIPVRRVMSNVPVERPRADTSRAVDRWPFKYLLVVRLALYLPRSAPTQVRRWRYA
jgi:hypothetical protein